MRHSDPPAENRALRIHSPQTNGGLAWRSRGSGASKPVLMDHQGAPPQRILRDMLKLDHISIIAPSLAEGVLHVRTCLDLDVPFGQRHAYMGTHNHLLQLGDMVYLEIVALDP